MEREDISEWGCTKGTGSRHGAGWSKGIKAGEGSKPKGPELRGSQDGFQYKILIVGLRVVEGK